MIYDKLWEIFKTYLKFFNECEIHLLHTLGIAKAGATEKSTGAHEASAKEIILASGFPSCCLAASADISTVAAAPSFNVLAFAAVIVPSFLKTAFKPAILSKLTLVNSSSMATSVGGFPEKER